MHSSFACMFISILYMFRAAMFPSSGELIVSIRHLVYVTLQMTICGQGSVVDIATSYGLDGPGIESRWGRDFPHLSRPVLGPTHLPVQ